MNHPYTPSRMNSSLLKNDGWKTIYFLFGRVTFQGRTVALWGVYDELPLFQENDGLVV